MSDPQTPGFQNQGMPQIGVPLVNENLTWANAWYKWAINLWQRLGPQYIRTAEACQLKQDQDTGVVTVIRTRDGANLGTVTLT